MDTQELLVNAIALSRKLCSYPIQGRLAYATNKNFLGRIVKGYHPDALEICLLAKNGATQLCQAQNEALARGFSLFIFDAFRPLRAVQDFTAWCHEPSMNEYEKERKALHYPHLNKNDLFRLGYISDTISQHCFGCAVDLSLINLKSNKLLNMGTEFDYFGVSSHLDAKSEMIGTEAIHNRKILHEIMEKFGFIPYSYEWWHFTYQAKEIDLPMDIEITPDLKYSGIKHPTNLPNNSYGTH